MTKSIEASGKTVEDAVAAALRTAGVAREEVAVEVLEKPKAGFFGFGSVDAKVRITYSLAPLARAQEFLKGLLQHMGVEAVVEGIALEDKSIELNIKGENMGVVIGRRGDTLDALQYITSIAVNRGEEEHTKITIDTENYRKKREEALENLAKKVAARVFKYKKSVTLEPMSAYERRVIHSALQNFKGVSTYSTGNDPNRRVVIAIAGAHRSSRPVGAGRPAGIRPGFSGAAADKSEVLEKADDGFDSNKPDDGE